MQLALQYRPFQQARETSLRDLIVATAVLDYESIHGIFGLDLTSGDLLHLRSLLICLADQRSAAGSPLVFSLIDGNFHMVFRKSVDGDLEIQVLDRDYSPDGYLLRFILSR